MRLGSLCEFLLLLHYLHDYQLFGQHSCCNRLDALALRIQILSTLGNDIQRLERIVREWLEALGSDRSDGLAAVLAAECARRELALLLLVPLITVLDDPSPHMVLCGLDGIKSLLALDVLSNLLIDSLIVVGFDLIHELVPTPFIVAAEVPSVIRML